MRLSAIQDAVAGRLLQSGLGGEGRVADDLAGVAGGARGGSGVGAAGVAALARGLGQEKAFNKPPSGTASDWPLQARCRNAPRFSWAAMGAGAGMKRVTGSQRAWSATDPEATFAVRTEQPGTVSLGTYKAAGAPEPPAGRTGRNLRTAPLAPHRAAPMQTSTGANAR